MKKIILFFFFTTTVHALELNYRLLDKPQVKSFIENQLNIIDTKYFNFLVNLLEIEQIPEFNVFFKSYGELGSAIGRYRKNCIYSLLDKVHLSKYDVKDLNLCIETSQELVRLLRQLDTSFAQSLQPLFQMDIVQKKWLHITPSLVYLHNFVTVIIGTLEPSLMNLTISSEYNAKTIDQTTLTIGNQLSVLHKGIRQGFIELIPMSLRRDLESFWLFYIDVLQERADAKIKRDYWTINLFDLNIKINEFFYSCERNKIILSKDTYSLCDDIHTEWNQILRMTLKF